MSETTANATRLPAEPRPFVPLLDYQRADVEAPDRFRWCCWCRQSGKSFTKALRRVLRGLQRGRNQILLSAGERQSRELMLKVQQHCHALRIACELIGQPAFRPEGLRGGLELRLPNRVRVIALPANPDTVRGFTGDVLLDEFAMHRHDREIWAAMFPTVLRSGGEMDIASTPKGCDNLFCRLRDNPRFAHSTVTLPQAIAAGLDADEDELRAAMDDEILFRQEFLCEFLAEDHVLLTYAQIAACEDPALDKALDLQRLAGGEHYVGVDIGRRRDLTVIWVFRRDGDDLVTEGVVELAAAPFRTQWDVLRRVLERPGVRAACIDATGLGMQLAETAEETFGPQRVEALTMTAALKARLAAALRRRVEDRTLRIPADEAVRNDWHSISRSVTAAGQLRLDAARSGGGHGDRFWAAALAVHAAESARCGPIEMLRGEPLRFARTGAW